jgi:hypothetical protein
VPSGCGSLTRRSFFGWPQATYLYLRCQVRPLPMILRGHQLQSLLPKWSIVAALDSLTGGHQSCRAWRMPSLAATRRNSEFEGIFMQSYKRQTNQIGGLCSMLKGDGITFPGGLICEFQFRPQVKVPLSMHIFQHR